jgi:hypothetical protein
MTVRSGSICGYSSGSKAEQSVTSSLTLLHQLNIIR